LASDRALHWCRQRFVFGGTFADGFGGRHPIPGKTKCMAQIDAAPSRWCRRLLRHQRGSKGATFQRESPQLPNEAPGLIGVVSPSSLNAKINPALISFTGVRFDTKRTSSAEFSISGIGGKANMT
jgi:hypothetical protein